MTKPVMETVTFRLNDGVTRADFARAAHEISAWITAQPGFVARRLSVAPDGTWIDQVEWASMDAAKAAAAAIATAQGTIAFLTCIDGASVDLRHSELEVRVN